MAVSSPTTESRTTRKVVRLAVLIVLFIAVYSVGWYFAAEYLRKQIVAYFHGGNPSGIEAVCENAEIGGYPFRFRLNCTRLSLDDKERGIAANFGAVRAAAQIYNPGHIVWELDGPAELRSAFGVNATSNWQNLQSSLRIGFSGLSRSSLLVENAETTVTSTAMQQEIKLKAEGFEQHVRQQSADLDYATLLRNMTISINGQPLTLPPISASIDTTFADKGGLLDPRIASQQKLHGTRGEVRRMVVDLGQGRVATVNGPFSIGETGLISGNMSIEIEQVDGWRDVVSAAYPPAKEMAENVAKVMKALSLGRDKGSADINIRDGKVMLGFIPLGEIPPL